MTTKNCQPVDLTRWLRYLLYVHAAGFALGLLSLVSALELFCSLASVAVSVAVVYILYRLGSREAGYRRGAVFMALAQVLQLVNYCFNLMMMGQVAFTPELAAQLGILCGAMVAGSTICSMIGLYQVYYTHGSLVPHMAVKWYGLFLCTLGSAATVSVVTAVAAAMSLTWLAAAATLVFSLVSFALEILRLIWLREMYRQLG